MSPWRCTRYVALHPLCGAAPEQKGCNAYGSGALPLGTSESVVGVWRGWGTSRWRCTRYVALHPNGRGVMPTDRVCCLLEQVKVWSV